MSDSTPDSGERPLVLSDRYELRDRIGAGGMGTVYRGYDRLRHQVVAIKTLRVLDDRQQALLLRESRLLRSLSGGTDAGFVRQDEVIVQGDQIFLIQEFIEGDELSRWQRGRRLSLVIDAYAQVASTLATLHQAGIVHRDLKPSNVLVRRETGRPVIMDLGVAVRRDEADNLTRSGVTVVGTPGYFSPEIVAGREVGPSSDVFSLGVMLVEAIVGHLPWKPGSIMDQTLQVLQADRDELLKPLAAHLQAAGVDALVRSMLAASPSERPTAAEVGTTLTALRGRPELRDIVTPGAAPELPLSTNATVLAAAPGGGSVSSPATSVVAPTVVVNVRPQRTTVIGIAGAAIAAVVVVPALGYAAVRAGVYGGIWLAVIVAGCVVAFVAARRRRGGPLSGPGASEAVLERIKAVEAHVSRAQEMTNTLALAIDHLGQQVNTDRLREIVHETVLLALDDLKPSADAGPEVARAGRVIAALKGRRRPSFVDRVKDYGGLVGGGITAAAGVVGLLGTTAIWQPNRPPEIVSFGNDTARLRRNAAFPILVDARDPDGDALTFTWSASVGRIESRGSGAIWIPPERLDDRLVSLTVTASDGRRTVSGTRTFQVNSRATGSLVVPAAVAAGAVARLSAAASDPDGDALTYEWSVSAGTLVEKSGSDVLWRAPAIAGTVEVLCHISDGVEPVSMTATVRVGH